MNFLNITCRSSSYDTPKPFSNLDRNDIGEAEKIFDQWDSQARKNGRILLLSSEALFNWAPRIKKVVKDRKVFIIGYQRNIFDYIVSSHNQLIKKHFETKNLEDYIVAFMDDPSQLSRFVPRPFSTIYSEWADFAGAENLLVKPYNAAFYRNGKIELDMLDIEESSSGCQESNYDEQQLRQILRSLTENIKIRDYLLSSTRAKLNARKNLTYSIYKLAEFLGIRHLERYETSERTKISDAENWFSQAQLEAMAQGTFQPPDFLRELAIACRRKGDIERAKRFIDLASTLRPKGRHIQKLKKEISELT